MALVVTGSSPGRRSAFLNAVKRLCVQSLYSSIVRAWSTLSALPQTAGSSSNTTVSHQPVPSSCARSDVDTTSLLDLNKTLNPSPVSTGSHTLCAVP